MTTTIETLPDALRAVAKRWRERRDYLGLRGKKADDAALHYIMGAYVGAEVAGDAVLAEALGRYAYMCVAVRGDIGLSTMGCVP